MGGGCRKGLGPSSAATRELLTPGQLAPPSLVPEHIGRPPYAVGSGCAPVQSNQPEVQGAEVSAAVVMNLQSSITNGPDDKVN